MANTPIFDTPVFDVKPTDSAARRRALADVAMQQASIQRTAADMGDKPGDNPTPAAPAQPRPEVPGTPEPEAKLTYRDWVKENFPDLIGKKYVGQKQLQAARRGYAMYLDRVDEANEMAFKKHGRELDVIKTKDQLASSEERRAYSKQARQPKQPTAKQQMEEAAARKAMQDAGGDPLKAKREYGRGYEKPPGAKAQLENEAAAAAAKQHVGDPLAALAAIREAGRAPGPADRNVRAMALEQLMAKHGDDPVAALKEFEQIGKAAPQEKGLITPSNVSGALAGDPMYPEDAPGLLAGVKEDPIGGWMKLKAYFDSAGGAMAPQQQQQLAQVVEQSRPTLQQLQQAWVDGYFNVDGGRWSGIDEEASKKAYVEALRAILPPEQIEALERRGGAGP